MQVLPSGLVIPPLPYAVALLVATVAVALALYRLRPAITEHTVLAVAPWMVLGGALHGLEQFGIVPDPLVPLATAPAVYVTVLVITGAVWAGAHATTGGDRAATTRILALAGCAAVVLLGIVAYVHAVGRVSIPALLWPFVGLFGAAIVTAPVAYFIWQRHHVAAKQAGLGGLVALYAHALDGVSTAIGVDVVGTGERTPIPRMIMDFAGTLPTAPYVGKGWLFVVVKLLVASVIIVLLADYVEEEPAEGNLLMIVVAAVGMGPAANNLTLFLLTGGI